MQKGLLYNMLLRLGKCFFLFPLFFIACDDLEDCSIRIIVRSLVILSIGKDVRTTTLVQTISGDWEIQPMT